MDVYQQYSVAPRDSKRLNGLDYQKPALVEAEVRRLFAGYGADVFFGKRHPAPCTTWRSERIQLDDEALPRFANRVHVFERTQGFERAQEVRAGRYLGYVTLRPLLNRERQPFFQYVAVANIAPPRYMLRPRYHLISCVGGPPDGVLPFRCTPFCFPFDDIRWQASCLHTSLQQALLLKMNSFQLTPVSSQEIIANLWSQNSEPAVRSEPPEKGATLAQGLQALVDEEGRSAGVLETIPLRDFALVDDGKTSSWQKQSQLAQEWVYLEAHRCMTDYLANGLPLIIELLNPNEKDSHAVLVFGMHLLRDPSDASYSRLTKKYSKTRIDIAELPGRFVLHDIIEGPYVERHVAQLLKRSWSKDDDDAGHSGISYLAIVPPGTRLGIYEVRKFAKGLARSHSSALWQQYLDNYFSGVENPGTPIDVESVRYVTRLLQSGEVGRRYFTGARSLEPGTKLSPMEMWRQYSKPGAYWWCVEVGVADGGSAPVSRSKGVLEPPPAMVYLWCVEDARNSPPRGQLTYLSGKNRPQMKMVLRDPQTREQRSALYAYRSQHP